jgi:hypothetical protein
LEVATMIRTNQPLLALLALAAFGCSSVAVSDRQEYTGGKLPRPGRILVHDFAATPADLPAWSEERAQFADSGANQTPEELEAGRKLGALVAKDLVEQISAMGLTAVRDVDQPPPNEGDIVLIGAFTSVDKGSALERVTIGFGKGDAQLKTHVAAYRMEDGTLIKLGSGSTDSSGGKTPGVIVPAIVTVATANPIGIIVGGAVKAEGELSGRTTIEGSANRTATKIADVLKVKFQEQGWI